MGFLMILFESAIGIFFIAFITVLITVLDKKWNSFINTQNIRNITNNEPDADFDTIYQSIVDGYKTKLDRQKKEEMMMFLGILLTLVFTFAGVLYLQEYTKFDYNIVIYIGALSAGVEVLFFTKKMVFKNNYKEEIIKSLIKSVNNSFEYSDDDKDNIQNQYASIGFVDRTYSDINSAYYIKGFLDENTNVHISDLTLEQARKYRDEISYITVFCGFVARMSYNNNIQNEIVIEENRVVDTGFELSQSFLNRLIEIYKKYGIVPEIRIKRGYAFLRIQFFELDRDPMDKQKLFDYYNIIKFINEIMTEIKNETEV